MQTAIKWHEGTRNILSITFTAETAEESEQLAVIQEQVTGSREPKPKPVKVKAKAAEEVEERNHKHSKKG